MQPFTAKIWSQHNRFPNDRWYFFRAIAGFISPQKVLYPGSYVDIAASMAFADVTYVDQDRRAKRFFDDPEGIRNIIADHRPAARNHQFAFVHADYTELDLAPQSFDLLISLYAGPISEFCTRFVRIGGHLLATPSHGDAYLAGHDPRYQLIAKVEGEGTGYAIDQSNLSSALSPKRPPGPSRREVIQSQKPPATNSAAFAYIFKRIA